MPIKPSSRPETPLVSVGLPVYNGERFLIACLDSLVAQDYPHFEIIISDNASTDATPAICEDFARRDERIRVFRADRNRGSAWNHNRVAALARGAYFKWCGADDICAPRFLGSCVAALEARPDAVLAYPQTIVIDETGAPTVRTSERLPVDSADVGERFASLMSALSVTQNVFYGLMRRAALQRVRDLGAFPAADRCLVGRLSLLGPFAPVPDYLMYRRQHAGNLRTEAAEKRVYNPADRGRYHPREWRVLSEHVIAVARAPLPLATKLGLLRRVAAWVFRRRVDFALEGLRFLRG